MVEKLSNEVHILSLFSSTMCMKMSAWKVPFIRKNPEDASTLPGLGFKVLLEKSVAKYNKHWKGDAHHSSVGHDLLF